MGKAFRSVLTAWLCRVPLGTWPEFCVQDYAGRQAILSTRSMAELRRQFWRAHLWYLRYVFHFLTAPLRGKPRFFLTGFPKCGTTYLADRLSALDGLGNPTSLAPVSKETLHYRNDQFAHSHMPVRGFYPLFSWRQKLFDASVSYSLDTGALKRVKADVPDARVILVVREQIGRFESGINYYDVRLWRKQQEELAGFNDPALYRRVPEEKIQAAIDYTDRYGCSIVATMKQPEIIEMFGVDQLIGARFTPMLYDVWVNHHMEIFGKENVKVIDFAQLVNEPVAVVNSVCGFIGLEESAQQTPGGNRQFNKHATEKVFRLNVDAKRAIHDFFRPNNERLKDLCGVDLNQHLDRHVESHE
jgi:hypothetical protein